MINDYVIEKLTLFFSKGLEDPSQDNIDILKDGITVLVLNIPKTILLILIAILLNQLQTVLVIMFFYGIIRNFSKGMHAKSALGCFALGMITYLGITFISPLLVIPSSLYNTLFMICFILYVRYAPSATAERPVGKKQHRNLKIASLLTIVIYWLIGTVYMDCLGNLVLLSVIAQLIWILPITYKISNQKGGVIYEFKETNEKDCEFL